ncbi:MAG TPA: GNAT family N-acetyltransferase [Vicinamibacterales bacterium]|nr:GNAT family N-acetyltransferase [Vicinamibacterales bacterium]
MRTGTILVTARLRLREMTDAHAPFILQLLNEPSFIRNIGDRGVRTEEDARGYIRRGPAVSYAEHGFGLWLVEHKETGEPVGMCGLLRRVVLDDPDIGFAFLPAHQSKGYGFESARAVLDYARDVLRLPRVAAIVNADNAVSARLLEKLGMKFEQMVQPFPAEPPLRLYGVELMGD